MGFTPPTTAALALAVVLPLALTGIARAQESEPPETEAYQRLLREALTEYDGGRYLEARALFRRAHEEQPNARTLRGIGMASFELREYVETLRALEAALVHPVRPLTDEQRASVRDLSDRARSFVGRFVVTVEPESAVLYVDGAPAERRDDGSILLDLGEHRFEVRCDGCVTTAETVSVRGGEDEPLSLVATGRRTDGDATGLDPGPAPVTAANDDGVSVSGIVFLATAGVLAGAAAASGVWWAGRGDEIARCEMAGAACRNLDTLRGEQTAAGAVTLGMITLAVAAATVGVILLVSGGSDERDDARRSMFCAPTLGGVGCAGTF
jgi:hypothetical protein